MKLYYLCIIFAVMFSGMFIDTSTKIIAGKEGTSILSFNIIDENVDGVANFIFSEQGWTVKIPAQLKGSIVDDMVLLQTTPVSMKYEGILHTMYITATGKKQGSVFVGEKTIHVDNQQFTLPFNAIQSG